MKEIIETKEDLAIKYADGSQYKSDYPHDWNSGRDGFITGHDSALKNLPVAIVVRRNAKLMDFET